MIANKRYWDNFNKDFIDATKNGSDVIIKLLINDNRLNPSIDNNKAIKNTLENGYSKIIRILIYDERVIKKKMFLLIEKYVVDEVKVLGVTIADDVIDMFIYA